MAKHFAAVIGWPVTHSWSPLLHNAAYRALGINAQYVVWPTPPESLAATVGRLTQEGCYYGANVTVPYKERVLPLCAEVDALAARIGAVNTLRVDENRRLCGHNTDVDGFAQVIRNACRDESAAWPKAALVLGAGGAARAVLAALTHLEIEASVAARDPEKAKPLEALGMHHVFPLQHTALKQPMARFDLLVDATSAGLDPDGDYRLLEQVPLDQLPAHAQVFSLVYHRRSALLHAAHALGRRTHDGLSMLIHQAAQSFKLMTGREMPLDKVCTA